MAGPPCPAWVGQEWGFIVRNGRVCVGCFVLALTEGMSSVVIISSSSLPSAPVRSVSPSTIRHLMRIGATPVLVESRRLCSSLLTAATPSCPPPCSVSRLVWCGRRGGSWSWMHLWPPWSWSSSEPGWACVDAMQAAKSNTNVNMSVNMSVKMSVKEWLKET